MKRYQYIGTFISSNKNEYTLRVYCNGFIQAFFLLTAKAIESGNHYQLHTILDEEKNDVRYVDDVCKVGDLITIKQQ